MQAVLDANFDLAGAVARVEQARARARIAASARLPTVSASLGANEIDIPANAGIGAQLDEVGIGADLFDDFGLTLPERLDLTTYTLSANFAYEVDFWGRASNTAAAAAAEGLAAEADFRAARIGVLADTAATYLEVVDLRRQWGLTTELIGIQKEQLTLAEVRYERGLTEIDALYQARRRLLDTQTQLSRIEGRLAEAKGRLWVLLGGYREDLEQTLPDQLRPIAPLERSGGTGGGAGTPIDVPARVLLQRPDIHAARERVEAAPPSRRCSPRRIAAGVVPLWLHRADEYGDRRMVRRRPMV